MNNFIIKLWNFKESSRNYSIARLKVPKFWNVQKIPSIDTSHYFQDPVQEEMSKTFCCLCCGTQPLTVNYSLPVRGYVPGQSMPIKVSVENTSGVTVDTVKLILCKVCQSQLLGVIGLTHMAKDNDESRSLDRNFPRDHAELRYENGRDRGSGSWQRACRGKWIRWIRTEARHPSASTLESHQLRDHWLGI